MLRLLKDSIIQQTPLMHLVEPTDKNLFHTKKISPIHLFMGKVKLIGKNLNDLYFTTISFHR